MNVCVAHLQMNACVAKNFGAWTEKVSIRHGLVEELALCIKSLAIPVLKHLSHKRMLTFGLRNAIPEASLKYY